MKNIILSTVTLMILFGFGSCKVADIRTDYLKKDIRNGVDGRALLEESVKAMGYDKLKDYKSYTVNSVFKWKPFWTIMPMNSLPGNKNKEIQFLFSINSFDGKVEYLEGRKKGDYHGIQSWHSYRSVNGKSIEFKKDKRRSWGLAAYHYLIEAPYRLLNAPIIKYAGTKKKYGKEYDLIFVTWGSEEANKSHDQWILYINRETKFVELCQLTIRDFFLPFPPNMAHATVQYISRTNEDGIHLPSEVSVQLLKPKKHKRYVYKFSLYDYVFNNQDNNELYPNPDIDKIGDSKNQTNK